MTMRTRALVSGLFLISGATALVYQVTWLRNLSLIFGMEFQATSIVLASFMAGLALGSAYFGRRGERVDRPLRLYGAIELGVAAMALGLPSLLEGVDALYAAAAIRTGQTGLLLNLMRVGLAFVALVVPTFFLGGTLPVLVKFSIARQREFGSGLAWLYGVNTLGAVIGTLAAGFALIPALGVWHTQLLAAVVNALVGAVALLVGSRRPAQAPPAQRPPRPASSPDAPAPGPLRLAFVGTFVCGLGGLAFEVMWTRGITLAVGSTTYSFTVMLAAFLIGIWIGSWLYAVLPLRRLAEPVALGALCVLLGVSSFATSLWIPHLPELVVQLNVGLLGDVTRVRPAVVLLLAFTVMLAPCILLGMAFPVAAQARERLGGRFGRATGDALALNTLGAILGSLLAGFALIPGVGLQRGMLFASSLLAAYGVIVLVANAWIRAASRRAPIAVLGAAALVCAVLPSVLVRRWDLDLLTTFSHQTLWYYVDPQGHPDFDFRDELFEVRYYAEGRGATVAVLDNGDVLSLRINGKSVATDHVSDLEHELLLGHLPVLAHPAPRSALVVGLGAGITLGAVAAHEEVERLVLVEIEPAVLGAARLFSAVNDGAVDTPRLETVFQDGRNYLRTSREKFDVITADPIHPWAHGSAYLFTREYYALARERLAPGGVMCQWLPAYELALPDFRSVVATFAENFEHLAMWTAGADAILLGSDTPIRIDLERLRARLAEPRANAQLARVGLETPLSFLGGFALDTEAVRTFAQGAVINTDDNLHLEFSAPLTVGARGDENLRAVYEKPSRPAHLIAGAGASEALAAVERRQRARRKTLEAANQSTDGSEQRLDDLAGVSRSMERARRQLEAVLAETSDYGPARIALSSVLIDLANLRSFQKANPEALEAAREAVRFSPDLAEARTALGRALLATERHADAIAQLGVAMRLRPGNWQNHFLLANALIGTGHDRAALDVLQRGLALKPDHRGIRELGDALAEHLGAAGMPRGPKAAPR